MVLGMKNIQFLPAPSQWYPSDAPGVGEVVPHRFGTALPLAGHSLLPDVFEQVQLHTHHLAARLFLALNM